MRLLVWTLLSTSMAATVACSDDDGANIVPNGPPGVGGGGAAGTAGAGGTGGGGTGGRGGSGGMSGSGGMGTGGAGGSTGCSAPPPVDAGVDGGVSDAGVLDAGSDGGDPDASGSGTGPGVVSFAADLHPIFQVKCSPCHVTDNSGNHNVGGPLPQAYDDAVRVSALMVQLINGGGMPPSYADPPNDCGAEGRGAQPGDEGCLTVDQVGLVQAWIDQCYPR